MTKIQVTFIGAGNVAWHLAPALDNAGYPVTVVYSRTAEHAEALSERLYGAEVTDSLDFSDSSSSIFIMAVADDAIPEVARELVLPEGAMLCHTSGTVSLEALSYAAAEYAGVWYPLQTFSKTRRLDLSEVPFLVEGDASHTTRELLRMAKAISKDVREANSAVRSRYHLAAVFACNFTNYLMLEAQKWITQQELDYTTLHPLIIETIQKSIDLGPLEAQTGPARRGDVQTIARHIELLGEDDEMIALYRMLSDKIRATFDT